MRILMFMCALFTAPFVVMPAFGDEPSRPFKPTRDQVGIQYSGTVTNVTKATITIQWPGENPKVFVVSETLAAGGFAKEPRPSPPAGRRYEVTEPYRYRLEDVKVGDEVGIRYAHLGDTDICDHISISRRPGGRVPPLPEGAAIIPKNLPPGFKEKNPSLFIPYHERMNAYWDLEERGIPYPEKFGPHRRFPVAPMPREK